MNGCVVVYGRLQPIIATLATGAIFIGIALFLRPTPGGDVDGDLSWAVTNDLFEFAATYDLAQGGTAAWFRPISTIPTPLVAIVLVLLLVWLPYSRSVSAAPPMPSARARAPPMSPDCPSTAHGSWPSRWAGSSRGWAGWGWRWADVLR